MPNRSLSDRRSPASDRRVENLALACGLGLTVLAAGGNLAQAGPLVLEYHDCLVDKTGFQLPDGQYNMRFKILQQIGTLQEDVEATFWSVDLQVSVGTGIFF